MVPEERDDSDDDDSRQRPQPIVTTTPELPECSDDSSEDGRSEDSSDRSGWSWPWTVSYTHLTLPTKRIV